MTGESSPLVPAFAAPDPSDSSDVSGVEGVVPEDASGVPMGTPEGGRPFKQVSEAVLGVQERLLALVPEDAVEEANGLLDELDELRREWNRMVRKQAEQRTVEKVWDRAERQVMGRFWHGRPNVMVVKAEATLKKVALAGNSKFKAQREFDEALWGLHVAYGYLVARMWDTNERVSGFRGQVAASLREWAEENPDDRVRRSVLLGAADRVERLLPVPTESADSTVGTEGVGGEVGGR